MRWPFRRRAAGPPDTSVERDRPQGSVVDTALTERAPARQWATLPVIPTTVARAAPLVVGPAPVVPPLRLDDRGGRSAVEPATGTVTGLARPVVRVAEPVTPVERPVVASPTLVRRAVRPAPTEVAPLVDATDEYVGAPREPAEPHRAPGWLRFMPDWAKQGQPSIPGLPEPTPEPTREPTVVADMVVADPPSFLPPELRNPPKVELPPHVAEGVERESAPPPPVRRRRPNLGQTRRLGLGAPIAKPELVHPESPPVVEGTVESSQEPPPPPAAPACVVTEPEPPVREPEDREPPPPVEPRPETPAPSNELASRPAPDRPTVVLVPGTYRATPELRPAPRRERPRGTVVDRVPTALANEVRTRQRADVADVPVYRGPKVNEAAKSRGARAFAAGGAVFLPDEAGPVDSPRARGLLAHELVHTVQQRTLGPRLPAPDSPLGQRLETEAQAAERFYGGEAGAVEPPPLIHAPTPAPPAAPEPDLSLAAQLATEMAAPPVPAPAHQPQNLHAPFDAPTTAEVGRIATESARHVVEEWTNPALQQKSGGAHAGGGRTAGARFGGARSNFDASAFRQVLVAQAVANHNAALGAGQSAISESELSQAELEAIDRQVEAAAAHNGATVPGNQPPAQHYEPNSAKSWMHAITGMNMNYGTGLTGFRDSAPVGSEQSWYGSTTDDKRPVEDRLADQLGLVNADTGKSYDDWFDNGKDDPNHPAQHEDNLFGRPNPDRSSVDVNKIDLDELATRLYDRLRTRLRTELLVDRERAGLLTDFR